VVLVNFPGLAAFVVDSMEEEAKKGYKESFKGLQVILII
jgi:hypothetical protein